MRGNCVNKVPHWEPEERHSWERPQCVKAGMGGSSVPVVWFLGGWWALRPERDKGMSKPFLAVPTLMGNIGQHNTFK